MSFCDHFSVNEMASRLNFIESSPYTMIPACKLIICELLFGVEHNKTLQTVNLSLNSFVYNHVTKLAFRSL